MSILCSLVFMYLSVEVGAVSQVRGLSFRIEPYYDRDLPHFKKDSDICEGLF